MPWAYVLLLHLWENYLLLIDIWYYIYENIILLNIDIIHELIRIIKYISCINNLFISWDYD